jgi:hypothetical protein
LCTATSARFAGGSAYCGARYRVSFCYSTVHLFVIIPVYPFAIAHYLVSDRGHNCIGFQQRYRRITFVYVLPLCFLHSLLVWLMPSEMSMSFFPRKLNEYQSNWAQMGLFLRNYVHEQHNMFTAGEAYYMILSRD